MAIAFVTNLGTAQVKASGNSLPYTLTAGQTVDVGQRIIVCYSADFGGGITSIADSAGNTWSTLQSFQDSGSNVMTFVFTCHVTAALAAAGSITVSTTSALTAKAMTIAVFSGIEPTLASGFYPATAASSGTAPTISSSGITPAGERLYLVSAAKEAATNTIGAVTGWTQIPAISTSGGSAASNVQASGAWKVGTTGGTAETYNPSHSSNGVYVMIMIALGVASIAHKPYITGQAAMRAAVR